jgi:hypothetical protein
MRALVTNGRARLKDYEAKIAKLQKQLSHARVMNSNNSNSNSNSNNSNSSNKNNSDFSIVGDEHSMHTGNDGGSSDSAIAVGELKGRVSHLEQLLGDEQRRLAQQTKEKMRLRESNDALTAKLAAAKHSGGGGGGGGGGGSGSDSTEVIEARQEAAAAAAELARLQTALQSERASFASKCSELETNIASAVDDERRRCGVELAAKECIWEAAAAEAAAKAKRRRGADKQDSDSTAAATAAATAAEVAAAAATKRAEKDAASARKQLESMKKTVKMMELELNSLRTDALAHDSAVDTAVSKAKKEAAAKMAKESDRVEVGSSVPVLHVYTARVT